MRILHVVLTPRHSGAEILVRDLARLHVQEGHSAGVCALNPSEEAFKSEIDCSIGDGVDWFLPTQPLTKLDRAQFVRKSCDRFKADIVIAHAVIPSIWTRLGLWNSHLPVVTVLHDASEDDFAGFPFHFAEMLLRYRNNAVVAVSEKALKNYRHRFGQTAKLNLIKNGIDIGRIKDAEANRDVIRQQFNLSITDRLLLQVGRISPFKGQMNSFKAMLPFLKTDSNIKLWFVGLTQDADYEASLEALIQENDLQNQVALLGSRNDIADLLAASDIFLMPSSQEAHSVAMLEGLASAGAGIISRIEAFDFASGLDGIHRINPAEHSSFGSMIHNCLKKNERYSRSVDQYSISSTSIKYTDLFERILR